MRKAKNNFVCQKMLKLCYLIIISLKFYFAVGFEQDMTQFKDAIPIVSMLMSPHTTTQVGFLYVLKCFINALRFVQH